MISLFIAILRLGLCKPQEATLCFEYHQSTSPICESLPGFPSLHANAVDIMPLRSHVNVYIYNGNGIKKILVISTVWNIFYSPRASVECDVLRCHSVVGSEQLSDMWLLLRPAADPISSSSVGLIFSVICKFLLPSTNVCSSLWQRLCWRY